MDIKSCSSPTLLALLLLACLTKYSEEPPPPKYYTSCKRIWRTRQNSILLPCSKHGEFVSRLQKIIFECGTREKKHSTLWPTSDFGRFFFQLLKYKRIGGERGRGWRQEIYLARHNFSAMRYPVKLHMICGILRIRLCARYICIP